MMKNWPAMPEIWVQFLGWEDPLKKGMATHSSILTWSIPCTEEPGGLQSMRSQIVGHNWVTNTFIFFHFQIKTTVRYHLIMVIIIKRLKSKMTTIKKSTNNKSWRECGKKESSLPKPLTVWITINRGKFWKRMGYQNTWPNTWETYMQVRKQHLELDMEQQTVSK